MINELKKRDKNLKFYLSIVLFSILFLLIASFGFVYAVEIVNSTNEEGNESILLNASFDSLSEGKNLVYFEDYINVKELVGKNPSIETVSYYDSFNEESLGYVNIFGGIGKNFVISPGITYEIYMRENINLNL